MSGGFLTAGLAAAGKTGLPFVPCVIRSRPVSFRQWVADTGKSYRL